MIDPGFSLRRWLPPWALGAGLVALSALPSLELAENLSPFTSTFLLVVALSWYWSLETRVQPEALPKLRVAGFATLALLMALMYGVLANALSLPDSVAAMVNALLLATAAASICVVLAALVDLTLLGGQRWGRYLVVVIGVVFAAILVVSVLRAHIDLPAGLWEQLTDPVRAPYPLIALVLLAAFTAPLEWLITLDRWPRLATLAGCVAAMLPLGGSVYVDQLFSPPHQHLLQAAVRVGSMAALTFLGVIVARAALALPGVRAYERKARELDAVYDFGLAAGTPFNPDELQTRILQSLLLVAAPDVAVVVEPALPGTGCRCVLLRADAEGQHVYRFRSRARWAGLAERFGDRRPVAIVDHRKAPPGVLERIWEPASGSSVIVPVLSHEGAARALLIAGRFVHHGFNAAEVRSLAGFASQAGLALEHADLVRELVEAERRKRELEIARELQVNLLPKSPPCVAGLEIADRSEPATEVGGDYFDYLPLDNDRLGIVVGDVSGHGMASGLLMAIAKSAIHTHVQSGGTPAVLMEHLGETLLKMSADNHFMTLVFAELDVASGRFSYANAGHHYPLHYRAATDTFEELESTGLPLGLLPIPPRPVPGGHNGPRRHPDLLQRRHRRG